MIVIVDRRKARALDLMLASNQRRTGMKIAQAQID